MKIIFRYSYLSAVLHSAKNDTLKYALSAYLVNSSFTNLINLDLSKLPEDYNGDNYDLILDEDCNFIKAEKNLNESYKIKNKLKRKVKNG